MSKINLRCPLQDECERKKCEFQFGEKDCPYYRANIMPDDEIKGQSVSANTDDAFFEIFDGEDGGSGGLVYVPTDKISAHPDNPRKDLGDLTELADSIKVNGVLQNLTVVPWFSSITRAPADNGEMDGYYVVVIGHRRLAAARLAGLDKVPCVISDMDYKTQLATMLSENMHRTDLTVYEQAQGMQMMLDLGESVESISDTTGFSETTVRRRVKLLELDSTEFKAAEERGATLSDYLNLDKVKDIGLKNELLKYLGTSEFGWRLSNAVQQEERRKNTSEWLKLFSSFATEVSSRDGYTAVGPSQYTGYSPDNCTTPEDADEVDYFYFYDNFNSYCGYLYLLREQTDEIEDELVAERAREEQEQKERGERKKKLFELSKTAYGLRKTFVKDYIGKKEHIPVLVKNIGSLIDGTDDDELADVLSIEYDADDERDFFECPEYIDICNKHPQKVLLAILFCSIDSADYNIWTWEGRYQPCRGLKKIYELLEAVGYQVAYEEGRFVDGTHEAYLKD